MNILVEGRQANNGTYYVHTGDVCWWLYYPKEPFEFADRIFLWEEKGALLGWCLLTPEEQYLDVFVHPDERGRKRAEGLYAWAEGRLTEMVKARGGSRIRQTWILEEDGWMNDLRRASGFTPSGHELVYTVRALDDPVPVPPRPEGYQVRPVDGVSECQKRAAASHAAFGSRLPFDRYWPRYLRFMESPVYARERDLVAVGPQGRVGSFCVIWLDPANKVGLFEPVGTHPDFQRKGLGRAVMCEGLRRMKAAGMTTAIVCAECDNPAAIGLYESLGFRIVNKLLSYEKKV